MVLWFLWILSYQLKTIMQLALWWDCVQSKTASSQRQSLSTTRWNKLWKESKIAPFQWDCQQDLEENSAQTVSASLQTDAQHGWPLMWKTVCEEWWTWDQLRWRGDRKQPCYDHASKTDRTLDTHSAHPNHQILQRHNKWMRTSKMKGEGKTMLWEISENLWKSFIIKYRPIFLIFLPPAQ